MLFFGEILVFSTLELHHFVIDSTIGRQGFGTFLKFESFFEGAKVSLGSEGHILCAYSD